MQVAKIIVLYSGGDINNLPNHTPTSIPPVFYKVPKNTRKRLTNLLYNLAVRYELQCGFRKKKSTQTAIIILILKVIMNNFQKI